MATYKTLPYKAEKEFHKVNDISWTILRSNESAKNYEKPERLVLTGAKYFIGYCEGDNHYLLFQGKESLVNADGNPELAKAFFMRTNTEGKWETDEESLKKWKQEYANSNYWCALECNFPILKILAKWLHNKKCILNELVFLQIADLDEEKLFAELDMALSAYLNEQDLNSITFKSLYSYGLDVIEPLEKLGKAKDLPLEVVTKSSEGYLTYEKVLFTLPPKEKTASSSNQRNFVSESAKANSKLDFLISCSDKVQELLKKYNDPMQLYIALKIAGVEIEYFLLSTYYEHSEKAVVRKPENNDSSSKKQETTIDKIADQIVSSAENEDTEKLKQFYGTESVKRFLEEITSKEDTGQPIDRIKLINMAIAIAESKTYQTEPKNVIGWAKKNLPSVKFPITSVLDLSFGDLEDLFDACNCADMQLKDNNDFSILDISLQELKEVPF